MMKEPLARKVPARLALLVTGVVLTLSLLAGCGPSAEELAQVDYAPSAGGDWRVSTPEDEGLDPDLVAELYLNAGDLERIYSLLLIKNGRLVAERYFNEGSIRQKARIQSVTKSFTSALVGIALDQACFDSVDQKMLEFYPDVAGRISDPRKETITVRQMLQMRAGYPWEESHADLWAAMLSGRYPTLVEDFPLVTDPGTAFHYSNLTANWLGIVVDRTCGQHLRAYAVEHLFTPLGIEAGHWGTDANGHNNGAADLHLTARDMAKFGLLYLNDGQYDGQQIVSADWVHDSLQTYTEDAWDNIGRFHDIGYGYLWWSATAGDHHVNFAWGHGGQLIALLDDLDLIVVVTSDPFFLDHSGESWKHEKANLTLASRFIASLPGE